MDKSKRIGTKRLNNQQLIACVVFFQCVATICSWGRDWLHYKYDEYRSDEARMIINLQSSDRLAASIRANEAAALILETLDEMSRSMSLAQEKKIKGTIEMLWAERDKNHRQYLWGKNLLSQDNPDNGASENAKNEAIKVQLSSRTVQKIEMTNYELGFQEVFNANVYKMTRIAFWESRISNAYGLFQFLALLLAAVALRREFDNEGKGPPLGKKD